MLPERIDQGTQHRPSIQKTFCCLDPNIIFYLLFLEGTFQNVSTLPWHDSAFSMMFCMEQHHSGLFFQVPDPSFCNPVLPVRIDTAVGNSLIFLGKALLPCVVDETTIVSMIMPDSHPSLPCIELEHMFCEQGLL
jgi:hypothetical protein